MLKLCILLVVLLSTQHFELLAQVDCEEFYGKYDSLSKEIFHPIPGYDNPPYPIGGLEAFYGSLKEKEEESAEKGKIFVQFVIDTTGRAHCARVFNTENELLNERAIALIEEAKFIPAKQRGKKVVSVMILPITFGEPPEKEKRCKR